MCSWVGLPRPWRAEMGAGSRDTTFPEPSSSGPGPRTSFGREDRGVGHTFARWAWLAPSSVWLTPCSPPSSLRQSSHSWQRLPFNLLPRKQHGQAAPASPVMGNSRGPQLRLLLPMFPGELGWETVLNCLGLPRSEISSAQLAAWSSQAQPRAQPRDGGRAGGGASAQESG